MSDRTRGLLVAVAATSVVAGSWPAAVGDDGLRDRRDSAERRVQRAERAVGESSESLSAATERLDGALLRLKDAKLALAQADVRVLTARARNGELRVDLDEAELRLDEAREALSIAVSQMADQRQQVADVVLGLFQGKDPGLLGVTSFLDSASTEDLMRREDATEVMLAKQARTYDGLRASQVLAQVGENHVEDVQLEVAARQRAAAANLLTLQEARRDARSAAEAVQGSVRQRLSAEREARRIRRRDLAVLRRAEAKEDRIREQIREAARRQAARAAARARARSTTPATADGFLQRPVAGAVTSPYGYRVHPIYKYWGLHDGIDYGADCGQPLLAGAEGVVTSKYYSEVFGNRLFVNVGVGNGKGVTLVYNHAASYSVNVGDRVARGQIIGSVGDTGWSTGCHLHFTVLANGTPVDPENWY